MLKLIICKEAQIFNITLQNMGIKKDTFFSMTFVHKESMEQTLAHMEDTG